MPTIRAYAAAMIATTSLSLFLSACAATPEEKVKQVEQKNAAIRESSGYNACIAKVKVAEQKTTDCRLAKVKAAGYDEWRDCLAKGMGDVSCGANDNARYKAEVQAYNECMEVERNEPASLTEGDCTKMLMDAMAQ